MGKPALYFFLCTQSAEGKWLLEFMTFCIVNKLPVDFISTHHYPTDSGQPALIDVTVHELYRQ